MKPLHTLLLGVLLALCGPALAADSDDKLCPDPLFGGPNLDEWQGDEVLLQLGLEPTQQQRIDAIKADHERDREANLQRLDQLQRQLDTLAPADPAFEDTIAAIAAERAELVGEQVRQRIRMVAAIQSALSPQQRVTLEHKMTERMRRQQFLADPQAAH